jgi:membrane-associated phospholipid phosphatase
MNVLAGILVGATVLVGLFLRMRRADRRIRDQRGQR